MTDLMQVGNDKTIAVHVRHIHDMEHTKIEWKRSESIGRQIMKQRPINCIYTHMFPCAKIQIGFNSTNN